MSNKSGPKKDSNICARTGCNNQIRKEKNGKKSNYCSSNCRRESPGSSEFHEEEEETSTSSNQWGVWTPDASTSYSSVNDDYEIFGNIDDVQVTPLWEDFPSNTRNSRYSSRNYSPPITPRSNSPSNEEYSTTRRNQKKGFKSSSKPKSTITSYHDLYEEDEDEEDEENPPPRQSNREQNNRDSNHTPSTSNYRNSSNQSSYSSYLDDYEDLSYSESQNQRNSASNSDNYENSYPRSRNRTPNLYDHEDSSHSRSRNRTSNQDSDGYEDLSYSRSRNRTPSLYDYEDSSHSRSRNRTSSLYDYEDSSYSRSRNHTSNLDGYEDSPYSRSRNRTSSDYASQSSSWIDDDDTYFESTPTRRPQRQRPPPNPYTTPSFFRDADRHSRQNAQRPPTPPDEKLTCKACKFENDPPRTHCELCFTPLVEKPEPNNRNTTSNRVPGKATKACKVCSYPNDVDNVQCVSCDDFFDSSLSSYDPDKIRCPSCTYKNHSAMAQCEQCNSALPGGNLLRRQQEYEQYCEVLKSLPGHTTKLKKLQVDDQDYTTVQQHFKAGIPRANILAIFKVIMSKKLVEAHDVHKRNNPASATHRMYHGTHVACDAKRFYGPDDWTYCTAANCGLCGIAQNGNSCAKSKYGGRMWFANNSATSLSYCRADPIKAMFIQDITSATGGSIIIVDKEEATLVKFLVIFQS